ncbi:hypothetical protein K438DRAFT_2118773 [Mycena galopus ATCC 62051]|nr:hypothetical protein K438DRAFT_2118773 [Mycena galopus ATCC 62051]
MVLEAVGTTAYTGAQWIVLMYSSTQEYPTAAASILAVEARHEAWINSAAEGHSTWDTGFQTALTLMQVYSLASSFITSWPTANTKSLPARSVSGSHRLPRCASKEYCNSHLCQPKCLLSTLCGIHLRHRCTSIRPDPEGQPCSDSSRSARVRLLCGYSAERRSVG